MASIKKLLKYQMLFLAGLILTAGMFLAASALAETAGAQPAGEETAAAAPAAPGDPTVGRMLFTGEKGFVNGGPPCISCHSVGIGALGGGTLGPNLISGPNLKGGPAPTNPLINSMWINNASTPVMGPIFSRKNITNEEVDHLKAFFTSIADQPPASTKTGVFIGVSAAGFVGVLIFFGIVWSNRFRNRVGGTAHEAIWRNYGGKGGQR